MSNPLAQHYENDLEVIELHGLKFHIKLPTLDNKRFQRATMSRVAKRNENGDWTTDTITLEEMADAQIQAFVHTCIRRVEGWPDFTPESLLSDTPDAAEELFELAGELVEAANNEVDESVKKSPAGLSGTASGAEKKRSTENLQSAAG